MDNFFSIICPMYNSEKTICRAIRSIVDQKYPNWELILVDDGSSDATREKCEEYLSNRVRYFFQKNSGPASARLYGTTVANGDYLIFLDSDDYLMENALSCLNNYLNLYDSQAVFFQENYEVDNVFVNKELTAIKEVEYLKTNEEVINRCYLNKNFGFGQCGGCFSKQLYKSREKKPDAFLNYKYCEDILDGYLLLKNAEKILLIPDKIYTYVRQNNSLTHSLNGYDIFGQFEIFNYVFSDIFLSKEVDKNLIYESFDGGLNIALMKYIFRGAKYDRYSIYFDRVRSMRKQMIVKEYLFKYRINAKKVKLFMFLFRCRLYLPLYILAKIL